MIHNVVVIDGKEYKAVSVRGGVSCNGCSGSSSRRLCGELGDCCALERDDKSPAIYKPHYRLKRNIEV